MSFPYYLLVIDFHLLYTTLFWSLCNIFNNWFITVTAIALLLVHIKSIILPFRACGLFVLVVFLVFQYLVTGIMIISFHSGWPILLKACQFVIRMKLLPSCKHTGCWNDENEMGCLFYVDYRLALQLLAAQPRSNINISIDFWHQTV